MNISYNWLKEFINVEKSAEEVAADLTSIGLEVGQVEEVESVRGGLKGLVVGEVLTCEAHPNSDHLHVTTVNVGEGEPLQIVCGAPNVAAGQKVIVATIGTVLYDGEASFTIKKSKLRGVESSGMLCAEDEIGVGTSHDGIIVLPAETQVGMKAADYYQIENDAMIEVDITANRSDAISHYGCARDLAAKYALTQPEIKLRKPSVDDFKVGSNDFAAEVSIESPEDCPRYTATVVKGVKIGPSPEWLKKAVETIGMRSINNVVDASNYVMCGLGQPIHTFDADRIGKNHHVVVKHVSEGTPFVTLDGEEHKLSAKDLLICNDEGTPLCLAGVFGGKESGITDETTNVFIESAYFNPVTIRETARRHGLQTDASFRYERGCDPNNTLYILKYAALLIQKVAGGEVAHEVIDLYPTPIERAKVTLKYKYVDGLVGRHIDKDIIKTILKHLEMEVEQEDEEGLEIAIPTYRVDVTRPADVVEDILRIYGYDKVEPDLSLKGSLSFSPNPNPVALQNKISDQLSANGFFEIMNNSLTKASYYENLTERKAENCVRLLNPLSQDLAVMRQTLLFGGLESIAHNRNHKIANLKFYEFGNCYYYHAERAKEGVALAAYSEDCHLGMWTCGNKEAQSWVRPEAKTSIYELKAHVENVLKKLGINAYDYDEFEDELYDQALKVVAKQGGKTIATIGKVAKRLLKQADIDTDVFYADINWNVALSLLKGRRIIYKEISKFPEVKRDLALLVEENVKFGDIKRIAQQCEKKLLKSVTLFDVYQGKNLEAGKKSYAVTFILQDDEKTLKDQQIDAIMQKIQKELEKQLGAKLR
ncbi:MAG: phenylalanine--tRNA ligase subunit beta [Paludibacteraceae bacterium]|nr:phenylalanine--tRNA ligase subunit beta [Paludibacteraceae bacterium]